MRRYFVYSRLRYSRLRISVLPPTTLTLPPSSTPHPPLPKPTPTSQARLARARARPGADKSVACVPCATAPTASWTARTDKHKMTATTKRDFALSEASVAFAANEFVCQCKVKYGARQSCNERIELTRSAVREIRENNFAQHESDGSRLRKIARDLKSWRSVGKPVVRYRLYAAQRARYAFGGRVAGFAGGGFESRVSSISGSDKEGIIFVETRNRRVHCSKMKRLPLALSAARLPAQRVALPNFWV